MVQCILVLRTILALLPLIWGGANCITAPPTPKCCSYGFDQGDKFAEPVFFSRGPEFRLHGKTSKLADGNPIWVEQVTFATIDYWTEGIEYRNQEIVIYKDRAFLAL